MSENNPYGDGPRTLSRREFVSRLAIATAGAGLVGAAFKGVILDSYQRSELQEALAGKVGTLPKRPLGTRMGKMMVAPIAICQDWPRDLLAPALAAGLNYIHKAGYWRAMPEDLKKVPRESYYTDITVDSTPNHPDDEDAAYRQVTEALNRTGFRYFDIYRAHFGWRSVREMKEQRGTYRAFQRLKREGKVKYFGVTQHDYVPYAEIIQAEIDEGLIDAIQLFYSVGESKEVNAVCEKARRAGIGMTAMKVCFRGFNRMNNDPALKAALSKDGMPARALYRRVLTAKGSNGKPYFDCCVSAVRNIEQLEENLGALSPRVAETEDTAV